MTKTCSEYREGLVLSALQRRLAEEDLSEEEDAIWRKKRLGSKPNSSWFNFSHCGLSSRFRPPREIKWPGF